MKFRRSITLFTAGVMLAGMVAGAGCIGAMAAENTAKSAITETTAKEIALKDAGLTESEVTFDIVETGMEQGATVYEIEFRTAVKEFDYDIAAEDGEIVKASWELRNPAANGVNITELKAKEIALKDANVKEGDVIFTKIKSGSEDRIAVYEVEFGNGINEYDYDIAKSGGMILSYSKTVKVPASAAAQKNSADNQVTRTGKEGAIEVALGHAGLTQDEVHGLKCEKDDEDGREIYEVEFKSGNYEYSYDIDAETYAILDWEKDIDD